MPKNGNPKNGHRSGSALVTAAPVPSTLLGTQQVLDKYLLSEQLSQSGVTHTAVQTRNCHISSSVAGSTTLGPSLARKGGGVVHTPQYPQD